MPEGDINSFIDSLPSDDGGAPTAPPPAAEPTPTPPSPAGPAATGGPAGSAEPATAGDPFDAGADTFDRAYVEKLRRENQTYRQRFNDAFDGFADEDRDFIVNVLKQTRSEDAATRAAAASAWRQVADVLSPAQQAAVDAFQADADGEPQVQYLTAADLDRVLSERESKAQQAQAVDRVYADVKELGYDPQSFEGTRIMSLAVHETDGDLKAAKERMEAEKQSWIDSYLASKADGATNAVTPSPSTGAPASTEKPIKTFADARAGVESYLDGIGA